MTIDAALAADPLPDIDGPSARFKPDAMMIPEVALASMLPMAYDKLAAVHRGQQAYNLEDPA
jgi:hypothetical protein